MEMSGWHGRNSQIPVGATAHHQQDHYYPSYSPQLRDYPYSQQAQVSAPVAAAEAHHHHHPHHGTTSQGSNCMCCPRPNVPYQQSPGYTDYHPTAMTSDVANDRHPTNNNIDDRGIDYFPQDPREWSDVDVSKWLMWAARRYSIANTYPERFQMNGKALCLMDMSMFVYRVQDGGDLLYQDFQSRLQHVLYDDRPR